MKTLATLAALCSSLLLAGCAMTPTASNLPTAGQAIEGSVYGGQQPINLARVYLMQANTTGYGQPSVSLLNPALTGTSDAIGGYVTTNTRGFFRITGDYTCTPGTQVYLLVLQGDAGGGNNTAAGEMGVFGQCPASGNFLATIPFVQINEITTVATAYAVAGFATDSLHISSSGTALAQTGIANAFANASNIASVVTAPNSGSLATTPGGGTVPAALVNTLGDIIATCVNSTGPGSPACTTLLADTQATDTASALISIAHNPAANVADLYNLVPAIPPFVPALTKQPNDFTLALTFYTSRDADYLTSTAIDASGAFWGVHGSRNLLKLNALGVDQTTSTTYLTDTTTDRLQQQIAIDVNGNAFVGNDSRQHDTSITEYSSSGALLSSGIGYALPSAVFEGLGHYLAFDPQGNLWASVTSGLVEYSPSGTLLSPPQGYPVPAQSNYSPVGSLAIDSLGYVWLTSTAGLEKFNPAGAMVAGSPFQGGLSTAASAISWQPAIDASGNVWYGVQGYGSGPDVNVNASSGAALFASGTGPASLKDPTNAAIDGLGRAYFVDDVSNTLVKLVLTPANGTTAASTASTTFSTLFAGTPDTSVAIDGSGDVWISGNDGSTSTTTYVNPKITEYIGLAAPVVTPLAAGVAGNTLGTRP